VGGVHKPMFLKEDVTQNFQGDGGYNLKTLRGRGVDIFWSSYANKANICMMICNRIDLTETSTVDQ